VTRMNMVTPLRMVVAAAALLRPPFSVYLSVPGVLRVVCAECGLW
jgi:hypothetical protein